ncbi:GET complex subunit get2 [Zygosaccharomyces mellis]|uniref:Golgi to ER traffic protein 2 n=1 Tax=Zygosaccharomyces mellis TaxID=42258 RepID=A0A4C2E3R1_9SACH|nr:GET complex subunit get2 [Zygosaccharomyces mellis]
MSELSDVEKRRILKERRQKKFSGGGGSNRLNKITGQADSLMSTESTLDQKEKTPESVNSSKQGEGKNVPLASDKNPQVSLFKQLAEQDSQTNTESPPDLMSMFQSMTGGDGKNGTPPKLGTPPVPVDQSVLDYHNYLVNNLKAWSIVIKWIMLIPYTYMVTRDLPLSAPFRLLDSSNFFSVLMGFEIVATSIYYSKLQSIEKSTSVNTMMYGSIIAKLISLIPDHAPQQKNLKSRLFTVLQYWDVVSMLITDICFVLIILGIFSHI